MFEPVCQLARHTHYTVYMGGLTPAYQTGTISPAGAPFYTITITRFMLTTMLIVIDDVVEINNVI